ncbi:abscisic acid receptor PYL4-like [Senna tora]|uniref:Abscisic acid receptor PYL4-like n=1 Tax=Senna tora TaxID=362788 RepID=A0A834T687_9FABA|nr:abscisic acid receptor PYL4-like [Senna tora]
MPHGEEDDLFVISTMFKYLNSNSYSSHTYIHIQVYKIMLPNPLNFSSLFLQTINHTFHSHCLSLRSPTHPLPPFTIAPTTLTSSYFCSLLHCMDHVISGLPTATITKHLDILDDEHHALSFSIVGEDHRLANYRTVTTLHCGDVDRMGGCAAGEHEGGHVCVCGYYCSV